MLNSASAIKAAEAALDKGDYNSCLKIINPYLLSFPADNKIGAEIRLLSVTAHMGMGEEQQAIKICQKLVKNNEAAIRQQAKQLLSILEAPSLQRPSNWSVEIPKIEMEPSLKSSFKKAKTKKKTYHPPTGPTKNLGVGFSIITLLIIVLITFLLSGCVNISTNLSVTGSDRLNITLDIDSNSSKSIPWQKEFKDNLTKERSLLKIDNNISNFHFVSSTISFEDARDLLKQIAAVASETSGFYIKPPEIITNNRNWIIGTKQNLKIYFDLRDLPKIPGLKINISMHNVGNKNNVIAKPLKPTFKKDATILPLEIGQINQLEVSYWKWNQLSIGLILIVSITFLSVFLQTFRLRMGFGFPELPP